MTIGVGILASNGLVVAADSQVTNATMKTSHGKITGMVLRDIDTTDPNNVIFSNQGGFVVGMAGQPSGYVIEAGRRMKLVFESDHTISGPELKDALQTELIAFYDEHIARFHDLPHAERPYVQLVIGAFRNNRRDLWYTDNALLLDTSFYSVIGSGETSALPIVERHFRVPSPDVVEALFLAAFAVHEAKKRDPYCGKDTDVICLWNNMFLHVSRHITRQIDALLDEHGHIIAGMGFFHALGSTRDHDAQSIPRARRKLRGIRRTILEETFMGSYPEKRRVRPRG